MVEVTQRITKPPSRAKLLVYINEFESGWLLALETDGDEWALWDQPVKRHNKARTIRRAKKLAAILGIPWEVRDERTEPPQ